MAHIYLIMLVEIKLKCEFEGACYQSASIVKIFSLYISRIRDGNLHSHLQQHKGVGIGGPECTFSSTLGSMASSQFRESSFILFLDSKLSTVGFLYRLWVKLFRENHKEENLRITLLP